jgi:hypothetical protein
MEPASAVSAGLSLYQAGGLALLLIAIETVGVALIGRWMMATIRELGAELRSVRDETHKTLVGVVTDNTKSNERICAAIDQQTEIIQQQTEAMRQRQCLVPPDYRPQQTPLPVTAVARH